MDEEKDQSFTIRDRRNAAQETGSEPQQQKPEPDAPKSGPEGRETGPMPPMDFSSFIFSLAATAQVSLGLVPDPQTNLATRNLAAAKQMIDIIALLKEKTKGNLDKDEEALVETMLANIRMLYVKTLEGKK